jgi:hypothetical protein
MPRNPSNGSSTKTPRFSLVKLIKRPLKCSLIKELSALLSQTLISSTFMGKINKNPQFTSKSDFPREFLENIKFD